MKKRAMEAEQKKKKNLCLFVREEEEEKEMDADAAAPAAAEEGQVIDVHSLDSWNELFQKGKDAKQLVVVDFTASWCGPCRTIAPVFEELAKKLPNVMFLKVDVDEMKDISAQFEVRGMPTFLFFKEGDLKHKIVGANKNALQAKVTQYAG